jgi:aryl-alcohol dehydrogenase-like predicted oxidoreductase
VGKIKYLGLSEISSDTLRRPHKIHPIADVQVEYLPFTLEIEGRRIGLLKICCELGVAVGSYSPLNRGMSSRTLKSMDDFEEAISGGLPPASLAKVS